MRLRGAVGCGRASVGAGFAHALSPVGAATFVAAALAGRRAVAITATAALLAARGCGRVVTADCAAFLACVLVVEPLALGLGLDALARRELRAGEESRLRLILVDPAFALAYHRTLAILAAVAPGAAISRTVAVPVAVADTIAVTDTVAVADGLDAVAPSILISVRISVTSPVSPAILALVVGALVTAAV